MEGTTTEIKKKPPAHEVILQEIANIFLGLPPGYFSGDYRDPRDWTDQEKHYAAKAYALLAVLEKMHIPASVLETVKQHLRARGLSSYYLDRLSE